MDLPLPFRPVIATRSPGARSRSTGPSRKLPRSATAASSETTVSPGRRTVASERCSSQGSYGLSTCSTRSSARSACRTLLESACVPRRSAPPVAFARKPPPARAWLRRACSNAASSRRRSWACVNSAYCCRRARSRAVAKSLQPPANSRTRPVHDSSSAIRVTVRSRKSRSCETTRDAALEAVQEALEPVEAVEVEVVRRLVEEEQVVAGEEDRCQRRASDLAPRQRRRLLLERDGKAELGADGPRPRLEVGSAQREVALERRSVGVWTPIAGVALDVCLCRRDAGAPGQVREQRLAATLLVLLRQISDRDRRGCPLDATLVRLVEAGGEPQQRRLAGAVRADEPEPGTRAERQIDAVEHGVGAEGADDAMERDAQGTSQRP